jgi:hypothetical protein
VKTTPPPRPRLPMPQPLGQQPPQDSPIKPPADAAGYHDEQPGIAEIFSGKSLAGIHARGA